MNEVAACRAVLIEVLTVLPKDLDKMAAVGGWIPGMPVRELESINSVHRCCRPESWLERTHFVFWFHDSTFECVARSFKVETHRTSMRALLGMMVERLVS